MDNLNEEKIEISVEQLKQISAKKVSDYTLKLIKDTFKLIRDDDNYLSEIEQVVVLFLFVSAIGSTLEESLSEDTIDNITKKMEEYRNEN